MRISIDRVKIAAFASEETICFRARVLLDGEPFAEASNDGHGGQTDVRLCLGKNSTIHDMRLKMEDAVRYVATLPESVTKWDDPIQPGVKFKYKLTLGSVVDELVADYEFEKKIRAGFKRQLRNYVTYVNDGEMRQYKLPKDYGPINVEACVRRIRLTHPEAPILNRMLVEDAYQLYRKHTVKS